MVCNGRTSMDYQFTTSDNLIQSLYYCVNTLDVSRTAFDDTSVCVAFSSWMVGEDQVRWPILPSKHIESLLQNNSPPPFSAPVYKVRTHKATGDSVKAKKLKAALLEFSEPPSSDATVAMERRDKRKM